MKKCYSVFLAFAFCLPLLSACADSTVEESNSSKKGLVLTATTHADFDELAYTLGELEEESDFIAEIKVTETSTYVYPDTDSIHTLLTPEIVEIYKGSYNNEKLDLCGGYMNYADYYSAPIFQEEEEWNTFNTSAYTEEELTTAQVYWDFCNNYVPEVGDTLIFFGKRDANGNYYVTNDYQGMFRLDGDNWTNQALIVNDNDWQEPLVTDLLSLSGAETVESDEIVTFTRDGITYDKPQSTYETMLSIPTDTLIAAIQNGISEA